MTLPVARETNPTIQASSRAAIITKSKCNISASKCSNISPVSIAHRSSEAGIMVTSEK